MYGIGTADNLCAKAELRYLKSKLLCGGELQNARSRRSIFRVWKWNYGTSKHYFLCGSGIADL